MMGRNISELPETLSAALMDNKPSERNLRTDVAEGLRQLEVGQSSSFDDAAVERIKQRGRESLKRNQEDPRDK